MSRDAQSMRWGDPRAQPQPRQDQPVPSALTRQPLLLPPPQGLPVLHHPPLWPQPSQKALTLRGVAGHFILQKKKKHVAMETCRFSLSSQAPTFPFPTCQLPHILPSTAGVSEDTLGPHTSRPSPLESQHLSLASFHHSEPRALAASRHRGFEDQLRWRSRGPARGGD